MVDEMEEDPQKVRKMLREQSVNAGSSFAGLFADNNEDPNEEDEEDDDDDDGDGG